MTPLFAAALYNYFDIIKILIKYEHLASLHPFPISAEGSYSKFLKTLLSDPIARDYYVRLMIRNPQCMYNALKKNPVFLTELAKHRNAIWCCLADSEYFNLSPEAHKTLLVDILRSEGDSPHPLRTLFSTPIPRSQGIFGFFCCSKETTLEDIRAYTVVRYPLNSNPAL